MSNNVHQSDCQPSVQNSNSEELTAIRKRLEKKHRFLRLLHPLMQKALSSQCKFELDVDGAIPDGQQCIFIANHYGFHDAPTAAKIIGRHLYVLVSDVDRDTLGGFAFRLNGVVWIHRTDKQDRLRAKNELLAHLFAGHDVLMYPEATWNLTPELPMLPMNWGVVKLSKETGVPICPIYLLFIGNQCHVKIGTLFTPTGSDLDEIENLRDRMATMFWELIEQQPMGKREEIRNNELELSIAERYKDYPRARKDPIGVQQYEESLIYKPKGITYHAEAFAHLAHITPTISNAFFFRENTTG